MSASIRRGLAAAGLLVLVALAVWWWQRPTGEIVTADLVDLFAAAEKRSSGPADLMFAVGAQRIRGEAKRAIYMHPTSRVTYRGVDLGERARLRTWVALKEDAWDKSTDGVLFRVGVAAEGRYDELLTRVVDPRNNTGDRQWVPVDIDLSAYANRKVDIILNTNTSAPGRGDDASWDFAVWGAPAIVGGTPAGTASAAR